MMTRSNRPTVDPARWWLTPPWLALVGGTAACGAALALPWPESGPGLLKIGVLGGGLLAVGGALSARLHQTGWTFDRRAATAGFVALAAVPFLLARAAVAPAWDSARMVLMVLAGLALVGAGLILLPTFLRKVAVSLIVLFHFGGIATAVLSAPPPQGMAPWIARTLWVHVYRPYLLFLYLNNAYHFYAPEPGPSYLLWCHLTYPDGTTRWVRVPYRDQFPTRQQYQRRIALVDHLAKIPEPVAPLQLEELGRRRQEAGERYQIPLHPDVVPQSQYAPPPAGVRLLTPSYARHVIHAYPAEGNPEMHATAVKVYRVTHTILEGHQFATTHPEDPTLFMPYFLGEYDADGNLLNPNDPFLYWLIPVLYTRDGKPDGAPLRQFGGQPPDKKHYQVCDYTQRHAQLAANRLR